MCFLIHLGSVMAISQGAVRDWTAAVDLIGHSWKQNRETPLDYTPEFVYSLLRYPGDGPVIAPASYDNGKLMAFVAGFPRRVRLQGQMLRLLLMSFFTVAPAYRGHGYGSAIWADCLRQAKSAGYDGALHYCVDGNSSNAITVAAAKSAGFEARHVFTVRYVMRLLRPGTGQGPESDTINTSLFLNAAESLGAAVPLTRLWSAAEAEWQMRSPGRLCSADAKGGVLTGYVLNVLDTAHTPCFFVDDILWGQLTPEDRKALVDRLLGRASKVASLAVLPMLEYADLSPFLAAGFRRSPRLLHAYLTLWHAPPDLPELRGMYVDVL
jgi:GNAT superfamily N-acetyltransferase